MNKKGFAVMFDWIFSIVAGVLIFSFLIYFAVQHTDLFGKITAKVVAEELDVMFSQYETTETKSVLDFGKGVELEFKCDEGDKRQWFKVNDRDGKDVWGKIIFAPEKIKSDKINVATASWNVPFRVANFVYLWDKRYELDYDPDFELPQWLSSSLPGDVKINFLQDSSLSSDMIEGDCPHFGSRLTADGKTYDKMIYYDKDATGKDVKGYICFKDKKRSFFYGKAMMMGAVFTDSKEEFDCVKKAAVNRFKIVNNVYDEKINHIPFENCPISGGRYNDAVYNTDNDIEPFDSFNFGTASEIESANNRLI